MYEKIIQANILLVYILSIPEWGHKVKAFFFFFLNSHVAYQIKVNDKYNYMQAILLSKHTPSTPKMGYYSPSFLE